MNFFNKSNIITSLSYCFTQPTYVKEDDAFKKQILFPCDVETCEFLAHFSSQCVKFF